MNATCPAASPGIVACWLGDVPDVKALPACECAWQAKPLDMRVDSRTLGVLVLYMKGVEADWVDLIITDLALGSLTESRITDLETELGASMADLEVARKESGHGHGMVTGSSSFTTIRMNRVGVRIA